MVYHSYETLEELHLEITNRCNAACPMCARNVYGGKDRDNLILDEWNAKDADVVFSKKLIKLRNVLFCGTHGDPAVAKDGLQIVEAVKRRTNATVEFYSNGGVRNKAWWADLGQMLSEKKDDGYYRRSDIGVFSIDGLADTNHLYRRRTSFEKVIENAQAFIEAGGIARWDYLVFKHNEHQVEEAEALAKKIGFKHFRIRKTSRFSFSPDGPLKHRVLGKNGELEYYLEPPSVEAYVNKNKEKFDEVMKKEKSGETSFTEEIRCLNQTQFNRMYVSAALKVYPCCFISDDIYSLNSKVSIDTKSKVTKMYGETFNSLRSHNWDEVLEHPWFKNELVKSWSDPGSKLIRCQRTCNVRLNPIVSQSQDLS